MAIDINKSNSIQAYQNSARLENANPNNQGKPALGFLNQVKQANQTELPEQPSVQASQSSMRTERQASLVAHLFGDGKSANESSLKLTFQAAIEKLNEVLSAEFNIEDSAAAPISEETLKQQGGMEYWTPENTAKRIVDGSTAFLAGFQAAHPELEGEALMDRFMEVVGGGVTQGFDEAKGLLGDLDVLKGGIEENIAKTYTLVQEGFQNFRNQYLGITETAVADNQTPVETETADKETSTDS